MERYFTLEYVEGLNNRGGKYKGDKPIIVAKKLAERLLNENGKKNRVVFSIRETTKDSRKKTFSYIAIENGNKVNVGVYKKTFVAGGDDISNYNRNQFEQSGYKIINVFGKTESDNRSYSKETILHYWKNEPTLSKLINKIYGDEYQTITSYHLKT